MILSDRDIANRMFPGLGDKSIKILPWPAKERFQPASVELTLGNQFIIDRGRFEPEYVEADDRGILLLREDFFLATTMETVRIPTDIVAQVNGKSSHARRGLVVHQTAGFIDPEFEGQITLELSNASLNAIRLSPGMPICQLVFFQMTSPAERPYGSAGLSSHYQGQVGPTPSAL